MTACYYDPDGRLASLARRLARDRFARLERSCSAATTPRSRRPPCRVSRLSTCCCGSRPDWPRNGRASAARSPGGEPSGSTPGWLARSIELAPEAVLAFSDVGSMAALPLCRRLGIPTILSMVHGDVREEQELLARETAASPDFMPIYLGDGALDRRLLAWLHERRLRDLALADRVLVPSEHIAETLMRHGTPAGKLRVIPYAADCRRFRPLAGKQHGSDCTFLFAGGISQRKGIKYLLEAWRRIRRPGWRLQLLGPLPADLGPLEPYLEMVEPLGRVSHAEMPERMAAADVFVFPRSSRARPS